MDRQIKIPVRLGRLGGLDYPSAPLDASPLDRRASASQFSRRNSACTRQLKPNRRLPVHIRWMIRRDMPEVLAIESQCFEFPWSEEDFIRCLRQRNCIGMVAEHNERVVGFMIYELHKNRLHILNFAVHEQLRRRGVGTQMVRKLVGKLSPQRRNRIMLEIRETNLAAQLFFRDAGLPGDLGAPRLLRRHAGRRLPDAVPLHGRGRPSSRRGTTGDENGRVIIRA